MAKLSYSGISHDQRTNEWCVTCDCGKLFRPPTTMMSKSEVTCPKCDTHYFVNYNEIIIIKKEQEKDYK